MDILHPQNSYSVKQWNTGIDHRVQEDCWFNETISKQHIFKWTGGNKYHHSDDFIQEGIQVLEMPDLIQQLQPIKMRGFILISILDWFFWLGFDETRYLLEQYSQNITLSWKDLHFIRFLLSLLLFMHRLLWLQRRLINRRNLSLMGRPKWAMKQSFWRC